LEDLRHTEDAKARHSAQVQTIRNKHDGLLSELKRTLENKIADLEKNFDQLHKSYKDTTDGANQNFKKLELEDARRAEFIKLQEQLIHKYQENLAHWSKVLASNYNECTARNGALRAQRDAIMKHCNGMCRSSARSVQCNDMSSDVLTCIRDVSYVNVLLPQS
jgi:hypothetical protein